MPNSFTSHVNPELISQVVKELEPYKTKGESLHYWMAYYPGIHELNRDPNNIQKRERVRDILETAFNALPPANRWPWQDKSQRLIGEGLYENGCTNMEWQSLFEKDSDLIPTAVQSVLPLFELGEVKRIAELTKKGVKFRYIYTPRSKKKTV